MNPFMGDIYDYRADMYYCLYCLQTDDLKAVVNHLRTDEQVSCIGLWGRSMGAVTWYYIHSTLCLRDIVVRITLQETFEMISLATSYTSHSFEALRFVCVLNCKSHYV